MKEIIIDVGANHGEFAREIAMRNLDIEVLAFEPEPSLYKELAKMKENIPNMRLYKYALADVKECETRDFNVSLSGDMGTSSLLEFNKNNLNNNEYWNMRSDLKHDTVIKVQVRSLASFLDEIDFDEIAFIKIDTQGFDLSVLKSAGVYFEKIQAGMLEVPAVPNTSLYNNETDTLLDVLSWLKQRNYIVYQIKSNDEAGNEYNVFFHRKNIDIRELEIRLNLKNFPMYDGRNYWFLPSNDPELKYDINILKRLSNIEKALEKINRKMKCSPFIRLFSCLIPNKKLRKKIRGESD